MKDVIKFIEDILKQRQENPFLDAIISFAVYFLLIIAAVLGFFFLIKVLPWVIKQTGGPIYKLFGGGKKEVEIQESYHHIDKPLKKIEF